MKIRTDIADLLRAGHSVGEIVSTLKVDAITVRAARQALGIPPRKPGPAPENIEVTFRRRAQATPDGHLIWTGASYALSTLDGASLSALRYAFRQRYGRAPVGHVRPGCGTPRCVHPNHVEDQPMREELATQLAAIFGSAA
ncbi:hypothetical protein [Streptomyces zaomyceticus]|uniref:hypothetical protein n=1 Tax=Streptomyces zaomyceticus TaxID=68286 RepID=UPI0037ADB72C